MYKMQQQLRKLDHKQVNDEIQLNNNHHLLKKWIKRVKKHCFWVVIWWFFCVSFIITAAYFGLFLNEKDSILDTKSFNTAINVLINKYIEFKDLILQREFNKLFHEPFFINILIAFCFAFLYLISIYKIFKLQVKITTKLRDIKKEAPGFTHIYIFSFFYTLFCFFIPVLYLIFPIINVISINRLSNKTIDAIDDANA